MRTLVKVCGIRRAEDARVACSLGANALGFVFWPASPRFVDPEHARAIVSQLPPFVAAVGVFVDQSPQYVTSVVAGVGLTAVQLHGDEATEAYLEKWIRVIKAVPVTAGFDPVHACRALPEAATMLLDAHDPIRRGGTGRTIDWDSAAAAARLRPVILSGGLTPHNAAEALRRVRPYAVDVSSGVESAPGVKDAAKLRAFFTAIASAHDTAQP